MNNSHPERFPDYAAVMGKRGHALYHAPDFLMERIVAGELSVDQVAHNSAYIAQQLSRHSQFTGTGERRRIKRGEATQLERLMREEPLSYNPNYENPRLLDDQSNPEGLKPEAAECLLRLALKNGYDGPAQILLARGWMPEGHRCEGLFSLAIRECNIATMQALRRFGNMFGGPDWREEDVYLQGGSLGGGNLLFAAVRENDPAKMQELVNWGLDPFAVDAMKRTLLGCASAQNTYPAKAIEKLIELGVCSLKTATVTGEERFYLSDFKGDWSRHFSGKPLEELEDAIVRIKVRYLTPLRAEIKAYQTEDAECPAHARLTARDLCALYGCGVLEDVVTDAYFKDHPAQLVALTRAAPEHVAHEMLKHTLPEQTAAIVSIETPVIDQGTVHPKPGKIREGGGT